MECQCEPHCGFDAAVQFTSFYVNCNCLSFQNFSLIEVYSIHRQLNKVPALLGGSSQKVSAVPENTRCRTPVKVDFIAL